MREWYSVCCGCGCVVAISESWSGAWLGFFGWRCCPRVLQASFATPFLHSAPPCHHGYGQQATASGGGKLNFQLPSCCPFAFPTPISLLARPCSQRLPYNTSRDLKAANACPMPTKSLNAHGRRGRDGDHPPAQVPSRTACPWRSPRFRPRAPM